MEPDRVVEVRKKEDLEALISAAEQRWCDGQLMLRSFPREAVVRGTCPYCALERVESIAHLIERYGLAERTLRELSRRLKCQRYKCDGVLDFEVK